MAVIICKSPCANLFPDPTIKIISSAGNNFLKWSIADRKKFLVTGLPSRFGDANQPLLHELNVYILNAIFTRIYWSL